jgi:rRNA-processing protein FCF1
LDGNFIFAALKVKLDIQERLDKLLQGETVRIHVLKSVLTELAAAGPKTSTSLEFAKSFCNVIDDSMFPGDTPCEKLKAMLGKKGLFEVLSSVYFFFLQFMCTCIYVG